MRTRLLAPPRPQGPRAFLLQDLKTERGRGRQEGGAPFCCPLTQRLSGFGAECSIRGPDQSQPVPALGPPRGSRDRWGMNRGDTKEVMAWVGLQLDEDRVA